MDWLNFLKVMAVDEKAARDKYQMAAELAETDELKAVFERLRDEEAFHVEYLEGEYAKLAKLLGATGE